MSPSREELSALFAAKCDGMISEEEHALLEKLLAESAEVRGQWFVHCDLETGLADWAATTQARSEVLPSPVKQVSGLWRWLPALAAVAVLALGVMWFLPETYEPVPTALLEPRASGIAVLSRAVGVEWTDGRERSVGTILEPGRVRLSAGAALVEFYSGVRLIVEGPAELELVSAGEAFLHSGKINAHVPPQATGFTVRAEGLTVVDHGTDFGISLRGDAAPEVHVFTGKVEVVPASVAPQSLHSGEGIRLEDGALQAIPATRSDFLTETELVRRDTADAAERLSSWREAARALSADDETVVHYTFEEADTRTVLNRSQPAEPSSQGAIVGCAWTAGRWLNKPALHFRSESDRVRFAVGEPMQTATLLAWVRVDALPRWQNVLLAAETERTGALRWHVTQRGELRLEIARDLGRPRADWEAVNSAPFVTSERLGQWLMLVTVFDGTRIHHYGNGQPIGNGASFTPPALHVGTAELANWGGRTQRQLAGAIDEFAILSRPLSAAEVHALYLRGRP